MNPLEWRFSQFMKQQRGAECLDSDIFHFPPGTPKADYLLFDRTVVLELKSLCADPQKKIQERVDQHLQRTGGIIFGKVLTTQLFDDPSESSSFHKSLYYAITRNIEAICRDANHQIKSTKSNVAPLATGILTILNQGVETLDPGVVAHRVAQYMNSDLRSIDFCLLIFESHQMTNGGGLSDPMLCIANGAQTHRAHRRVRSIMKSWSKFNGQRYIELATDSPDSLKYVPQSQP